MPNTTIKIQQSREYLTAVDTKETFEIYAVTEAGRPVATSFKFKVLLNGNTRIRFTYATLAEATAVYDRFIVRAADHAIRFYAPYEIYMSKVEAIRDEAHRIEVTGSNVPAELLGQDLLPQPTGDFEQVHPEFSTTIFDLQNS